MEKATILNRKRDQILTCGFGYIWPLNLHTTGYVKVIDPDAKTYIWASDKKTLEIVNVK